MKITSFLFVCTIGISAAIYAQPKKVIADKIVAQVGDKIILRSDIYNSIQDAQRQGTTITSKS
ncbi:MAG: hypothetical protein WKG06_45465 [Segetibacter sp.]